MQEFLLDDPVELTEADLGDLERRKAVDDRRVEEQRQFYEIASKRAAEVDVHMERFRRDIIESSEQHHSITSNERQRVTNSTRRLEKVLRLDQAM